jgi:hypothetical protein
LALALLLVGVVSGTLLRHVVQIVPIVLVVALLRRRPALAAYAALPIFAFWLFVCVMIWLFLLGVSGFASGTFSPVEILSTFAMAGCSLVGAITCVAAGRGSQPVARALVVVLFLCVQLAAMFVSFLRPIANR